MKIIIYSADWCPYCDDVKNYLDSRDLKYEVRDIDRDPAALKEMLELNNGETYIPVTMINGQILRGFNKQEFARTLESYDK